MTAPTHLIMVLNRDTCELKLVSAHTEDEAEAAYHNLAALFATTPNDVHKVTIPTVCGFSLSTIKSSSGVQKVVAERVVDSSVPKKTIETVHPAVASSGVAKAKNGIRQNAKGEYVQRLPDGSEIISESDFSE